MSENTPIDSSARAQKSEHEWRKQLRPARYEVLREKGTEPPFSGQYVYEKRDGTWLFTSRQLKRQKMTASPGARLGGFSFETKPEGHR